MGAGAWGRGGSAPKEPGWGVGGGSPSGGKRPSLDRDGESWGWGWGEGGERPPMGLGDGGRGRGGVAAPPPRSLRHPSLRVPRPVRPTALGAATPDLRGSGITWEWAPRCGPRLMRGAAAPLTRTILPGKVATKRAAGPGAGSGCRVTIFSPPPGCLRVVVLNPSPSGLVYSLPLLGRPPSTSLSLPFLVIFIAEKGPNLLFSLFPPLWHSNYVLLPLFYKERGTLSLSLSFIPLLPQGCSGTDAVL